jgi:hypothetical protein
MRYLIRTLTLVVFIAIIIIAVDGKTVPMKSSPSVSVASVDNRGSPDLSRIDMLNIYPDNSDRDQDGNRLMNPIFKSTTTIVARLLRQGIRSQQTEGKVRCEPALVRRV